MLGWVADLVHREKPEWAAAHSEAIDRSDFTLTNTRYLVRTVKIDTNKEKLHIPHTHMHTSMHAYTHTRPLVMLLVK